MELTNLYGSPGAAAQQDLLLAELNAQNAAKRRTPTPQPWADGSAIQFGFDPAVPIP
jgi:hypothetical protein